MGKTIIIGSNGALGLHIVNKAIEKLGLENIVISDYKSDRLESLATSLLNKYGKKIATRVIDINSIESVKNGLQNISNVIIALQQNEPIIQKICITNRINTIDLSVKEEFINKAVKLKSDDQSIHLLAGGLFPGLSGIIANDLYREHSDEIISVGLLQSSNGSNGKTGVSDMLKIFNERVEYYSKDEKKIYPGFYKKKLFNFYGEIGKKKLRLCNFIERDILKKSNIVSNFYSAFDDGKMNSGISILRRIGVLKLLNNPKFNHFISGLVTNNNLEQLDEQIGINISSKSKEISIILKSDYEATASCCISYLQLLEAKNSSGILYPYEVFTFDEIDSNINDVIVQIIRK